MAVKASVRTGSPHLDSESVRVLARARDGDESVGREEFEDVRLNIRLVRDGRGQDTTDTFTEDDQPLGLGEVVGSGDSGRHYEEPPCGR